MRLMADQSLASGFIPINTRQQKASLPFNPGVREWKVKGVKKVRSAIKLCSYYFRYYLSDDINVTGILQRRHT